MGGEGEFAELFYVSTYDSFRPRMYFLFSYFTFEFFKYIKRNGNGDVKIPFFVIYLKLCMVFLGLFLHFLTYSYSFRSPRILKRERRI